MTEFDRQFDQRFLTVLGESGLGFSTVLVANRGEIAVRVVRTCRELGLTSVAVYADEDRDSPHVQLADHAHALGACGPRAYLDRDRLVGLALAVGAEAVHPGYGFLSEDADFAAAVQGAGLVWVGPPPEVIARLGDKVRARQLARQLDTPTAPGTPGPVDRTDDVLDFIDAHGLPVVLKAAHGGGGRGLKMVHRREDVADQFAAAVREATAAFGRGECFVEKLVERPRHIETQCLADRDGTVVIVSTRDCSLQRRSQKLVEEAPAPFLDDEQRRLITESSRRLLAAAGYVGAGTCEFLLGEDGTISFLEVNTRLQVEHPVTEEVTGLDLVAEQLRLAAGGLLVPGDPETTGHALEFRLNAEDAAAGFLPALGTVVGYQLPGGPGVRVDSGIALGTEVTSSFDSLLAKLVVVGHSREHALRRARRALAELQIRGVTTVVHFHRALLDHPDFTAPDGRLGIHTQWLESASLDLVPASWTADERRPPDEPPNDDPEFAVEIDGRRVRVRLAREALERLLHGFTTSTGTLPASSVLTAPPRREALGRTAPAGGGDGAATEIAAPMNGTVVRLLVREGEIVDSGDTLAVLEAMKMEQNVVTSVSGVVRSTHCGVGEAVEAGALLIRLTPA